PDAGRAWRPGELRRAGADLDAADPFDPERGPLPQLRQADADAAAGAAEGAGARLRHAGLARRFLHLRRDHRADRRQADHLAGGARSRRRSLGIAPGTPPTSTLRSAASPAVAGLR